MPENRASLPATPPSMLQLGRRLILTVGLALLALVSAWLASSWVQIRQVQLQRMNASAVLIAGHADSYFGHIAAELRDSARHLAETDPRSDRARTHRHLEQLEQSLTDLVGATLVLPNGDYFESTRPELQHDRINLLADPEWREDFEQSLRRPGFSVGRPQIGQLLKQWIIPFRYTIFGRDNKPWFVLQTSILLDNQQNLWRNLSLEPAASIGLLRDDGYLISRLPYSDHPDIYRRPNLGGALYLATRVNNIQGSYQGQVADSQYRYGSYQRLAHLPLYAFVSHPRDWFLQLWWDTVRIPLYLIAGFFFGGMLIYLIGARRFGNRMHTIREQLRSARGAPLPSSGVSEIDVLCHSLAYTQERLRDTAHNRERLLLRAASAATYAVRARDGVVVAADQAFLDMLGRRADEVIGRPWRDLAPDSDEATSAATRRLLRKDGEAVWLSLAEYEEHQENETIRQGLAIDVSEREHLLNKVRNQSERLQALWRVATDRERSELDNFEALLRHGMRTLGMDVATISEQVGQQLVVRYGVGDVPGFAVGAHFELSGTLCSIVMREGGSYFAHDLTQHPDLRNHPLVVDAGVNVYASAPIRVDTRVYGTVVFMRRQPFRHAFSEDDKAFMELLASWFGYILSQARQRQALEAMAMTDSLTGLPNRRAAEMRLATELDQARDGGPLFAVAVCDLDRFKLINDHYGHDVGDQVLTQVSRILAAELKPGEWLARWGGEEFIALLRSQDLESAMVSMQRLCSTLRSSPIHTAQGDLEVTTSVGLGLLRSRDEALNDVLSEADGCLYEAKRRGRDCVVSTAAATHGTLWRAGMLQHALREQRITAAYQIIVDLDSGDAVADEALARLMRADGQILPAGEFIEAAEGINLIHRVDSVVSRLAMNRCAEYLRDGKAPPALAHFVNVSPQFLARRELVEGLLDDARRYCETCGVEFGAVKPVVFEITERELLSDFKVLLRDLKPFLDYGFRLALDDFGSGYSSFLYLAELPVSFLKIEGWMVRNARTNAKVANMVAGIVGLARQSGITTVAEGVEDAPTAAMMRGLGVNWAQGYYFGRPQIDGRDGP